MYQNHVLTIVNIREIKYLCSAGGSHFQVEQQILKMAEPGGLLEATDKRKVFFTSV